MKMSTSCSSVLVGVPWPIYWRRARFAFARLVRVLAWKSVNERYGDLSPIDTKCLRRRLQGAVRYCRMRLSLAAAAALFLLAHNLLWAGNEAAEQLLTSAEQQGNLFRDNRSPILLEVSFVAQQDIPVHGHLSWRWAAKDRWWRKVDLSDFQQIEIRNDDKLYTIRNLPFTPFRVGELISLLQFAPSPSPGSASVKKQKQRVENGIDMTCMRVKSEAGRDDSREICIETASRDIVTVDWREPPDELRREQFADYFEFDAHRYPRKLDLVVNGSKAITAHVDELTIAALDERLLLPPKGAVERRQCAGMKHAIPVSTPDPMYPKSASQNRIGGDTIVAMTVLADGSVRDIQLMGRSARSLDEATLDTLKRWKFKPAMCGTEPVVSDIQVVVSFRME